MNNEYTEYIKVRKFINERNKFAHECLPHLRPAITRTIMSASRLDVYGISYQRATVMLGEYLVSSAEHNGRVSKYSFDLGFEANKLEYFAFVRFCYRYCFKDKTFASDHLSNIETSETLIRLPLRYRDRFHKSALAAMVLSKLTK